MIDPFSLLLLQRFVKTPRVEQLAVLAFPVQHAFYALRILLNKTFEQKVIFDLRSDLYSHIQLLPLPWFDNRATDDLITRVIEDVNAACKQKRAGPFSYCKIALDPTFERGVGRDPREPAYPVFVVT